MIILRGIMRNLVCSLSGVLIIYLGMRLANLETNQASSTEPDGDRKLWTHIWSGSVPPKVNVFCMEVGEGYSPNQTCEVH